MCVHTVYGLESSLCNCTAQVMMMVGIRPVPDALGRVNKLEVIPLEELGRPRIDVVVNCSGVFRDLFVNQMLLLDRAIKMAAELDEPDSMNFVRKHAKEQVRRQRTIPCACMPLHIAFLAGRGIPLGCPAYHSMWPCACILFWSLFKG